MNSVLTPNTLRLVLEDVVRSLRPLGPWDEYELTGEVRSDGTARIEFDWCNPDADEGPVAVELTIRVRDLPRPSNLS